MACLAVMAMGCMVSVAVTNVADYRDDFHDGAGGTVGVTEAVFGDGWSYLWNAPVGWSTNAGVTGDMATGLIGDTNSYIPLLYTGNAGTPWTADADTAGTNHNPDRFVRATPTGGHPGAGNELGNSVDRAAIFAYTLQPSDPTGFYWLTNTLALRTSTAGDGDRIYIHVNEDPMLAEFFLPPGTIAASNFTFDVDLGYLAPGDTVFVAFGTDGPGTGLGTAGNDGFSHDFTIAFTAIPEPTTWLLLCVGGGILWAVRYRRG